MHEFSLVVKYSQIVFSSNIIIFFFQENSKCDKKIYEKREKADAFKRVFMGKMLFMRGNTGKMLLDNGFRVTRDEKRRIATL